MLSLRSKIAFGSLCILLGFLLVRSTAEDAAKNQEKEPPFIQLNYEAWKQIEPGMTEDEVVALIGPPYYKSSYGSDSNVHYPWHFGYLTPESVHFPSGLNRPGRLHYRIRFHKGKVADFGGKEDPFDGRFSPDGKPMVPQLISPPDNVAFDHYPRYVDLRWYPSSGDYPMTYEIELRGKTMKSDIPFATVLGVGQGQEPWRVRAINAQGTSEWSEYFTIHFER